MAKDVEEDEKMALFKYSLIVPALNGTFAEKSVNEYFIKLAQKEQSLPNGKKKSFSVESYRKWYYQYKKNGFNGLRIGERSDSGVFKKIPDTVIDSVCEIVKTKRHITKKGIYEELCSMGEIRKIDVGISTFYRFLKRNAVNLTNRRKWA